MTTDRIRIAQIGCGAWGKNILRCLASRRDVEVCLVVDPSTKAQATAHTLAPRAQLSCELSTLDNVDVDAAVVASPGPLHAAHAMACIEHGLDVLVEKPMTTRLSDAEALVRSARDKGRVGMVGHLMRHHPAWVAMLEIVRSGCVGSPCAFHSSRFSTSASQSPDGSLLWALGPHDVSLVLALDPGTVHSVRARTGRIGQPSPTEDNIAVLRLHTKTRMRAHIALSRVSPQKVRSLSVECEGGTLIFDDLLAHHKVLLVRDIQTKPHHSVPIVYDESIEPLQAELDVFMNSIRSRIDPVTSLKEGMDVVSVLVRAEQDALRASASRCVQSADWALRGS